MSDTPLFLLEPADPGAAWAPFAGVRPLAELRAGVWRIRERWEAILGSEAAGILGDHVAGFHEGAEPPVRSAGPVSSRPAGSPRRASRSNSKPASPG
jgi:hypothetical protein